MGEELSAARWGWCPGVQNKPAKREACDDNERAMDLDAKQAELEEKTRFAASFCTTCVKSTEHCKLSDAVPSEVKADERRNAEEGR